MRTNLKSFLRSDAAFGLLLAALTLLAYLPVFNAGFIWDDDHFITDNPALRSVDGLRVIWTDPVANPQYYPLLLTFFWLQFRVFGLDPTGYHVVTMIFHVFTSLAVWRLAKRLVPPAAAWCALLFALHPVQVQSVAWVTELKNTLSGFFYVAALVYWIRYLDACNKPAGQSSPNREYAWTLVLFVLATLSKTTTSSWPLAALLIAIFRRAPVRVPMLLRLVPMVALGFFIGWVSVVVEHSGYGRGVPAILTMPEKVIVAGRSLWFYVSRFLWPDDLMLVYPRWPVDASRVVEWLWVASVPCAMALLWVLRRRISTGPFFCAVFFVVGLAPIPFLGINFVYLYSFVADHFIYIPSLALVLPFGYAVHRILREAPSLAARILSAMLIGSMLVLTLRHSSNFQSTEKLWRHNVTLFPESVVGWMNYGYALSLRHAHDEEIAAYRKASEVDPEYAPAHNDLGLAYAAKGDLQAAEASFRRALELDPGMTEARHNIGNILARKGLWRESIPWFEDVLSRRPDHLVARLNLSHAYRLDGRPDMSETVVSEAIRQDPESSGVWYEVGMVALARGRTNEAVSALERAISITPDFPDAVAELRALVGPVR